jgi:hypothetical protein
MGSLATEHQRQLSLFHYFATLPTRKIILWCYLIWYLNTTAFYFDPNLSIWLNSLGISVVIGIALVLSVSKPEEQPTDPWQTFRLFLMPFCVSSFSSLIKGRGYCLILPPEPIQQLSHVGFCLLFIAMIAVLRRWFR